MAQIAAPASPLPALDCRQSSGLAAAPPVPVQITVIQPARPWVLLRARELWGYRELLAFFVWRDIKVQYKQTVLGAAWALWQPTLNMVIFTILFGGLLKVPTGGVAYPLFVFSGLLPWTLFAGVVNSSSNSLLNQSHLVTKIYFPRVLLPLAEAGTALVNALPSFGLYAALMLYYRQPPGIMLLLVPLLICLVILTGLAVGLILSCTMLIYRDVRYVVPSLVQAWMYLTPVIYGADLVPARYQWLLHLNPLTGSIGAIRSCLLGEPVAWPLLARSVAMAIVMLVIGLAAFHRSEPRFADVA
jgi:lipopolysaccharide transport system permease protein